MFKKILSITGFVFVLLFALVALKASGYVSFTLFLALAFWISPFSDFLKQSFKYSKGKKALSIIGGVIVFFVAIGTFPSSGASQGVSEETNFTVETTEQNDVVAERTLPFDESTENIECSNEEVTVSPSTELEAPNINVADSQTVTVVSPSPETVPSDAISQADSNNTDGSGSQIIVAPAESTTTQINDLPVGQTVEPSPSIADFTEMSQTTAPESDGSGYNFDTYYIPENQQTTETWVLNTSSMKIHHPDCKDVVKIKPENYATSSLSLAELQAMGYTTCGHCFK